MTELEPDAGTIVAQLRSLALEAEKNPRGVMAICALISGPSLTGDIPGGRDGELARYLAHVADASAWGSPVEHTQDRTGYRLNEYNRTAVEVFDRIVRATEHWNRDDAFYGPVNAPEQEN